MTYAGSTSATNQKDLRSPTQETQASTFLSISDDVLLGEQVKLAKFINLYGCSIGDYTKIGAFVEVQRDVTIGRNCKISSHTFVCEGVSIGDNCFIGHGVMFINDRFPCSVNASGALASLEDWEHRFVRTQIGREVSIGTNATIMGGITVGDGAYIGAGSVVTKDIPAGQVWVGNPARYLREVKIAADGSKS